MKYLQKMLKIEREREREREVKSKFLISKQKIKKWFTLIELLIVITILGSLSVSWYQWYSYYMKNNRDTVRKSQINNIWLSMITYSNENNNLPNPSEKDNTKNKINITKTNNQNLVILPWTTDKAIWYEGVLWEHTGKELWNIKNIPKDPKTKKEYTYYIDEKWLFYYIEALMEKTLSDDIVATKNNMINKEVDIEWKKEKRTFYYTTNFDENILENIYNNWDNIETKNECNNWYHMDWNVCIIHTETINITGWEIIRRYNPETNSYVQEIICNENYELNSTNNTCTEKIKISEDWTLTEPVLELLGKRVFIPKDNINKQWAIDNNYDEPIWNPENKKYIYPSWRTKTDYPAFEYCEDRWMRLPTKWELLLTINYRNINNKGAISIIDWIMPDRYWSSNHIEIYKIWAWNTNFSSSYFNWYHNIITAFNNKMSSYWVFCIYD